MTFNQITFLGILAIVSIFLSLSISVEAGNITPDRAVAAAPESRFAALRFSEVNMRTGPGKRYPIEWVYRRSGLPVEIVAEFDVWRRIRDWEGSEGWVHKSMLRSIRTGIITEKVRIMRAAPSAEANIVARVEPGVVAEVEACENAWCRLSVHDVEGYLPKNQFWGAYPGEQF